MRTDVADLQNSLTEDSVKVKNPQGLKEGRGKFMEDRSIGCY